MQGAGAFQWGYQCETSSRTRRQLTLRLLQGEKVKISGNRHNDTLPCESCRRFLRPCTFKDEPPPCRRQQTSIPVQGAYADISRLPVLDNQPMLSPGQNLGFGSQPLITFLMSMVISWTSALIGTFFPTNTTPTELNLTQKRNKRSLNIPQSPTDLWMNISRPFLSDSLEIVSLGPSHPRVNLTTEVLDPINEQSDHSIVH